MNTDTNPAPSVGSGPNNNLHGSALQGAPLFAASKFGKAAKIGQTGATVHAAFTARFPGYVILFCDGRGMRDMVRDDRLEVTCRRCVKKLAALGETVAD